MPPTDTQHPILDFSTFLSDGQLEEIATAAKASPKGRLLVNILYLLAGNGHYRGASAIADAAGIVNSELHRRGLLGEKEEIIAKLIYAPSLLGGFQGRVIEWAARDLYESLSRIFIFQYSWNEMSRQLASKSKLDAFYSLTRKVTESVGLRRHLDGVVLSAHFAPADILSKYPQYANRHAVISLDDNVYPHIVRKETQHYFVGSSRCGEDVIRSLAVYGVSSEDAARRVHVTGQPVSPRSIKGAPWNPAADAAFWDGERPPRYVVAMGGAGAQLPQMEALLSSYTKYGGRRPEIVFYVGHHLEAAARLESLGGPEGTRVIKFQNRLEAIEALHSEIRKADALITKPSELAFYPLPVYALSPIGFHEELNLSTAIIERRARLMSSLWNLPLDPLEELAVLEEDLPRMQRRALFENPNVAGAFNMVYQASKLAPAGKSG